MSQQDWVIAVFIIGLVLSLIIGAADIHIAIYTPKKPDGSRTLLLEIGNPDTSDFSAKHGGGK